MRSLLHLFFLLLPCFVLITGCAHQDQTMPANFDATRSAAYSSQILGRSAQSRSIILYTFNVDRGPNPVLILAAIHGDEPTSAYCANQLLHILQITPYLAEGTPVAILPVANPDGLAAGTRVNSRGVDLNRNFPSANAVPLNQRSESMRHTLFRNYPGPSAASEPETRILIHLIQTLHPRRICSIHSIGQGRQQNNYDGPAKDLAELMTQNNHYPASPNIGYPTPGSLGAYAGIDLHIPMITLELPARQPGPQAWVDNRSALLAFIRGH